MAAYAGPNVVANGLVMLLDARDFYSYPGSGTGWYDISGNGVIGTLVNSPTFSSSYGGGVGFNGSNQGVTTTLSAFPTNFTIDIWFYPTNNVNKQVMIGNYPGPTSNGLGIEISGGNMNFFIFYSNVSATAITNGAPILNTPQNAVASLNGTAMSFYQNLNSLGTATLGGAGPVQSSSVSLAYYAYNSSDWFTGTIFSAKVYNRALSFAEITQNFNAHRGRFGL
jgi:hypothetical protein